MSIQPQRHHVRTLIGVSAVYALTALLAAVLIFLWCRGAHGPVRGEWAELTFIASTLALIAFVSGFALTRHILHPGQRFMERADELLPDAVFPVNGPPAPPSGVLDRVEALLANIDARQLFPEIVFNNWRMKTLMRQVRMLAPTDVSALISGENGTGKTLMAETIHRHSDRSEGPFVRVSCTALPAEWLARELFGDQEIAPPGATPDAAGALTQARGGTLLLKQIAALPMALQVRLHTAIATGASQRHGEARVKPFDVRLIGTTPPGLEAQVAAGQFHGGLHDHLQRFKIELPPLRERIEDIALLAARFRPDDFDGHILTASALQALIGYHWPGNVEELKDVIEEASANSDGSAIDRVHLPVAIQAVGHGLPAEAESATPTLSIDEQLQAIEKQMIENALEKTGGIQVRAAELMGINQRSLWHRIKKYGIDAAVFKKDGASSL